MFGRVIPNLEELGNQDTALAYSALQYIEGLYLVSRIVQSQRNPNIVFILPNDEHKYYVAENGGFETDLRQVLIAQEGLDVSRRRITVSVQTFTYMDAQNARPYIGSGPKIGSGALIRDFGSLNGVVMLEYDDLLCVKVRDCGEPLTEWSSGVWVRQGIFDRLEKAQAVLKKKGMQLRLVEGFRALPTQARWHNEIC